MRILNIFNAARRRTSQGAAATESDKASFFFLAIAKFFGQQPTATKNGKNVVVIKRNKWNSFVQQYELPKFGLFVIIGWSIGQSYFE